MRHGPEGALSDASNCSTTTPANKRLKPLPGTRDEEDSVDDSDAHIVHRNQPVYMSVYQDYETQLEKLIIIMLLPGGATNAKFSLVGDGPGTTIARVDYFWPTHAVNVEEIFAEEIAKKIIPPCHPKIVALTKELQNYRDAIDLVPQGSMELTLPIPVQTVASSISFSGQKRKIDGMSLMVVELMAYQSAYTLKQEAKQVVFKEV